MEKPSWVQWLLLAFAMVFLAFVSIFTFGLMMKVNRQVEAGKQWRQDHPKPTKSR